MKIRLYQHLNKYLNSKSSSGVLLIINILLNVHIDNLPFKRVTGIWPY